jgi:hypothetical protein
MRKMTVTCDVCSEPIGEHGYRTTVSRATEGSDTCSPKCTAQLLYGLGDHILGTETKRSKKQVDVPASPPSVPATPDEPPSTATVTGCAACDAGTAFNAETAFKHTGDGERCKGLTQGPCQCEPANWKMESPPEVVCGKCGNMWIAKIKTEDQPARRPGRPKGSKNRPAPVAPATNGANGTNGVGGQDELARLKAKRDQEAALVPVGPPVVFPNPFPKAQPEPTVVPDDIAPAAGAAPLPLARDMTLKEAPRWCSCGLPLVFNKGAWACTEHPHAMPMAVKQGLPGENLSQLITDAAKLGAKLNLIDVAQWQVTARDMVRAWIAQPGSEPPAFLAEMMPPPPPPPAPATQAAKPRFTF